jgi:hypothetical protein
MALDVGTVAEEVPGRRLAPTPGVASELVLGRDPHATHVGSGSARRFSTRPVPPNHNPGSTMSITNDPFEPAFEDTTTVPIPVEIRDALAKEILANLDNCCDSMAHALDMPEEGEHLRDLEAAIAMRRLTLDGTDALPRWAAIRAACGAIDDIAGRLRHDSNEIADAREYIETHDRVEAFLNAIDAKATS